MAVARMGDERLVLLDELLFGRSASADTRLQAADASSRHALVFFEAGDWCVRDLGSTNGTYLNGKRMKAGETTTLKLGDALSLGGDRLVVEDLSAPSPAALSLADGRLISGAPSVLLIPDEDRPLASVCLEQGTRWALDVDGVRKELQSGDVFEVASVQYRFHGGRQSQRTAQAASRGLVVARLELLFHVSLDEEHVTLRGRVDGRELDFGARAHHYLLLTLARQRLQDAASPELAESSRGWVDSKLLTSQLGCNETKRSVDICRVRQQLAKAGFDDAADVLERRVGTGQLRLGVHALVIGRV